MSKVDTTIEDIEKLEKGLIKALFQDIPTLRNFRIYWHHGDGEPMLGIINNTRSPKVDIRLKYVRQDQEEEYNWLNEGVKAWLIEADLKETDIELIGKVARCLQKCQFLYKKKHTREDYIRE